MKKTHFVARMLTLAILLVSSVAFAAPKGASAASPAPTGFSTSTKRIGLGLTTGAALTATGNTSGFSGWFELSPSTSIQAVFGIANTSPSFEFGLGGYFRSRVAGNESAGFHLGGGVVFGTVTTGLGGSDFYTIISPIAGMHFNVPNYSNLFVMLDGGINLRIISGSFSMGAQGLTPSLGFSIHYLL